MKKFELKITDAVYERLELQAKLAKVNLNKVINFHIANSLQELDYSTDSEEEIVQYIKQDRMN